MKRINLSIDLKENEIFDEEITNTIKAKVREFARNEQDNLIEEAANEEIKRLMYGRDWGYNGKMKTMIRAVVGEEMKEIISTTDIQTLVAEKVNDRLDYFVSSAIEKSTKSCTETIDKIINEKYGLDTIVQY